MKILNSFLLFGVLIFAVGCGEEVGTVADNDEVKAYIDEHGSHSSEPEPSEPITDD